MTKNMIKKRTIKKHKIPIFMCKMVRCGEQQHVFTEITRYPRAIKVIRSFTDGSPVEKMIVLYLNADCKLLGAEQISQGSLCGARILTRDVLRGAIIMNSYSIIIGHNHPSGSTEPSDNDIKFTKNLVEIGDRLGIQVLKHFIVTDSGEWNEVIEEISIKNIRAHPLFGLFKISKYKEHDSSDDIFCSGNILYKSRKVGSFERLRNGEFTKVFVTGKSAQGSFQELCIASEMTNKLKTREDVIFALLEANHEKILPKRYSNN